MSDRRKGSAVAVFTPLEAPSGRARQLAALRPAWQPGKSGNPRGRPKGSRNKLSEDFIAALYDGWGDHGASAITRVAKHRPHEYLKIVASLVPRNFGLQNKSPLEEPSDEELEAQIDVLRRLIAADRQGQDGAA